MVKVPVIITMSGRFRKRPSMYGKLLYSGLFILIGIGSLVEDLDRNGSLRGFPKEDGRVRN